MDKAQITTAAMAASGAGSATGAARSAIVEQLNAAGAVTHRSGMVDGVLHGDMTAFAPNGKAQVQARYDKGSLDGVLKVHDEEGAPAQEATFVKGVKQGITRVYMHGRLLAVQNFVAGVLHGETVSYAESGDIASRQMYFQGKLEGESVFLSEGRAVRRARFHQDKLEGETTIHDRDGVLVQREIYKDNLLEGPLTRYWPDGKVMERILYRAGKPIGAPQRFDSKGVELRDQAKASLMQRLEQLVKG